MRAVHYIAENDAPPGAIAIVSHGAVGTLLHCHLAGKAGGGNYFAFTLAAQGTFLVAAHR